VARLLQRTEQNEWRARFLREGSRQSHKKTQKAKETEEISWNDYLVTEDSARNDNDAEFSAQPLRHGPREAHWQAGRGEADDQTLRRDERGSWGSSRSCESARNEELGSGNA
jgi:hypothetical protein